MSEQAFRPCPFCGAEYGTPNGPVIEEVSADAMHRAKCGCGWSTRLFQTRDQAIKFYNKRGGVLDSAYAPPEIQVSHKRVISGVEFDGTGRREAPGQGHAPQAPAPF